MTSIYFRCQERRSCTSTPPDVFMAHFLIIMHRDNITTFICVLLPIIYNFICTNIIYFYKQCEHVELIRCSEELLPTNVSPTYSYYYNATSIFSHQFTHFSSKNSKCQDNVVGIVTAYGLDDRGVGVWVPVGSNIFSSPRRPDRLWGPPNLYPMGNGNSLPGGKAAGLWSWPLIFN
jgi:hypothetical protein